MLTPEETKSIDTCVIFHVMGLIELHEVNARGIFHKKMSERTIETWAAILDCIHEKLKINPQFTQEEYTKLLQLIINHTSTAGAVETLRVKRQMADEEEVGKDMKERIQNQLDKAIEERNEAFEKYEEYLKSLNAEKAVDNIE